jgi:hypothetical protein
MTQGYLEIPDYLASGNYLLGIFASNRIHEEQPVCYQFLYVCNPKRMNENIMGGTRNKLPNSNSSVYSITESKGNYQITIRVKKDNDSSRYLQLSGTIKDKNNKPLKTSFSASVIDHKFYDFGQDEMIANIRNQNYSSKTKSIDVNYDSIMKASRYIRGTFLINDQPAEIKKVYLYTSKDNNPYLDNYITDYFGNFNFPEPPFFDSYLVEIFAIPESDLNYTFKLNENNYFDSLIFLNLPEYSLPASNIFASFALKKHLIDQSYILDKNDSLNRQGNWEFDNQLISHKIILDEYIHFPTLAEIIRELVPQVTVKYKKGKYEIRVYDSRARNYCCKEDPLIFINNQPFPDNSLIMNLNTEDIYSIEVIRPIEAIRSFGDIGINGILKINFKQGIPVPEMNSPWKEEFIIQGIQSDPDYSIPDLPENYPDFRNFLFWDGYIKTGSDGSFNFTFKPSLLQAEYLLIIRGITESGEILQIDAPLPFGSDN